MTAETSNARGEWVLVPREPTGAMIDAWRDAPDIWEDAYAAMLAAAPQPPSAPDYPITATCRVCDYDYRCVPVPAKCGACGTDLPPSAPVGVEAIAAEIRASLVRGATVCTRRRWAIELEALAQQPAAVDGMAELVGLLDEVRSHFTRDDDLPDDLLPRIDAALAAHRQEPTT